MSDEIQQKQDATARANAERDENKKQGIAEMQALTSGDASIGAESVLSGLLSLVVQLVTGKKPEAGQGGGLMSALGSMFDPQSFFGIMAHAVDHVQQNAGNIEQRILNHFNAEVADPFDPRLYEDMPPEDKAIVDNYRTLLEGTATIPGMGEEEFVALLKDNKVREQDNTRSAMQGILGILTGKGDAALNRGDFEMPQKTVGLKTAEDGTLTLLEVYNDKGEFEERMELIEQDGKPAFQRTSRTLSSMSRGRHKDPNAPDEKSFIVPYDRGLEMIEEMVADYRSSSDVRAIHENAVNNETPVLNTSVTQSGNMTKAVGEFLSNETDVKTVDYTASGAKTEQVETIKTR